MRGGGGEEACVGSYFKGMGDGSVKEEKVREFLTFGLSAGG